MDERTQRYQEYLLAMGVTEDEINLVSDINGYCTETMLDILYAMFGYREFENEDGECLIMRGEY